MDLATIELGILTNCGLYAYSHSIATSPKTACVTTMNQLKNHLITHLPSEYVTITSMYGSLERFLKGAGRVYMRSELTRPWSEFNYELLTFEKYMNDKRHEHNCFSDLNITDATPSTILFVFYYKEEQRRFESERATINKQLRAEAASFFMPPSASIYPEDPVSNQIQTFYESVSPSEEFFSRATSLVKRIQKLVNSVWPDMNYRVTNFGSTANRMCFSDADLDLCIVVPKTSYEQDLKIYKNRLSRQSKSVYNMYFLCGRLKEIGMTNVEPIGNATVPICKFVDPETGFRCDINANNVLGIENTRLIGVYADLDKRVRPLITAIKHFVKQKDINSPVGGTLSSYAYVLMVLHFLIAGLKNPVLPSLQYLDANCQSRYCHSRTSKLNLVCFNYNLVYCDTRYHDCVQIQNTATQKYMTEPNIYKNEVRTIWKSHNKDSLSQLLCKFFDYFSDPENHIVSIYNNRGELVDYSHSYWNDYIIVQDPFLHSKNVARTCTSVGLEIITKEFQRAVTLLKLNTPFSSICDKQYNLPKPIDTESMDYRFNQQKQQKLLVKQQQMDMSQTKDERVDEEYEKNLRILLDLQKEAEKRVEEETQQQHAEKHVQEKKEEKRLEKIRVLQEDEEKNKETGTQLKEKQRILEETAQQHEKNQEEKHTKSTGINKYKEILSQDTHNKETKPIHALVDKLLDHRPLNDYGGTSGPCTDMHALLADPMMKDLNVGEVVYLAAQLKYLGSVIGDITGLYKSLSETGKKEFGNDTHDFFTVFQSSSFDMNHGQQSHIAKEVQLIQVPTVDEVKESEEDTSLEYEDEEEILFDDRETVEIQCLVENVPKEIDNYEIYTQLAWHGRVVEITPDVDERSLAGFTTWRIHMQVLFGNLKTYFPAAIQLGISETDFYTVSTPVIV